MNYRHRIIYLVVKKLKISHAEAKAALANAEISLDTKIVKENELVGPYQALKFKDFLIQNPANYQYFAYHKPRGIECTLNGEITDSLKGKIPTDLFYAGRLDKASEGLLLLTNDGNLYNKIIQPERKLKKVYEVCLEKEMHENFITAMATGVEILGKKTLPCKVEAIDSYNFTIVLEQGMNRQIRRMSFALGNYVVKLKRIHIGEIELGNLRAGEIRPLSELEISYLRNLS